MKLLFISISMLFSSLIIINFQDDQTSTFSIDSVKGDNNFTTLVDIRHLPSCQSCHGNEGEPTYSPALDNYLNENFDPSLIIHQANNSLFVQGLETFVETHDDDEAWAKYVDRQKVIELITEF